MLPSRTGGLLAALIVLIGTASAQIAPDIPPDSGNVGNPITEIRNPLDGGGGNGGGGGVGYTRYRCDGEAPGVTQCGIESTPFYPSGQVFKKAIGWESDFTGVINAYSGYSLPSYAPSTTHCRVVEGVGTCFYKPGGGVCPTTPCPLVTYYAFAEVSGIEVAGEYVGPQGNWSLCVYIPYGSGIGISSDSDGSTSNDACTSLRIYTFNGDPPPDPLNPPPW